jgi:cysteine synthase A
LAILKDAEARGVLKKGGLVVEATSGNTGIGLAVLGGLLGYKVKIFMPESMSKERREMMQKYGAEVELTAAGKGMQGAVERAKAVALDAKNAVYADQFCNPACIRAHYEGTGVEIWAQTQGKVDCFLAGVGTGGTLTGVGRYLKEQNSGVKIVAIEPSKSPLLSQGIAAAHGIQGIGANFVPRILDRTIYDEVLTVTDDEALETARLLREKEGLFVGISSGANVAAAVRFAGRKENKNKRLVTILPDCGDRYTW